jgi:hypothetical protein
MMRRDDERRSVRSEGLNHFKHCLFMVRIKMSRRLVEEQTTCPLCESSGDPDKLTFAPTQSRDRPSAQLSESDGVEGSLYGQAILSPGAREEPDVRHSSESHRLLDTEGERWLVKLRDSAESLRAFPQREGGERVAVEQDSPRRGPARPVETAEECRLA